MVAGCKNFTGSWAESVAYDDPIQGAVTPSCSLIAALASLAWVYPQGIKINTLEIPFFNASTHASAGMTTITKSFWMEGTTFIHAHSSDAGEIWPAIYEKAYAKWKNGAEICDISLLGSTKWPGNGVTALVELTGWQDPGNTYSTASSSASATYTNIVNNYCAPPGAGTTSYQVKYPGAAWTTAGNPSKGIPANHEYSILGVYTKGGIQYIVLRNPKGANPPSSDLLDTSPSWQVSYRTYQRGSAVGAAATTKTVSLSNGTFALKMDAFKSSFNAYGFVK